MGNVPSHEQGLAGAHAAHDGDADQRSQQPERCRKRQVVAGNCDDIRAEDVQRSRGELLRHQQADQRRDCHRGQARDRIAADHQFERIEGAGKRRPEGAGDASRGAAPDQHPQVAASQAESLPDEGGDAAGELGIARFQADRCTDPLDHTVCAATIRLPRNDMRPP